MAKITYKNLFSLVNEQIDKRTKYSTNASYNNQLLRTGVAPLTSNAFSDISANELITAVQNLLKETLPATIIDGLEVEATDPISNQVTVNSGSCSIGGKLFTIDDNADITVPFNDYTYVFYINIYLNGIEIETNTHSDKVTIAKIIVPKPGTTNRVKDNKDDDYEWDAYIVSLREQKLYGDDKGQFDSDTVDLIKDNIGDILAEKIVGNIRLSENLKIINTQGTLELNSSDIKIKDVDGDVLAKFDRNGTFFYDNNGVEVAKFSVNEARIGNIKIYKDRIETENFVSGSTGFQLNEDGTGGIGGISITTNTLESGNFVSGFLGKGFQLSSSGDAEFQNIKARGKITTTVFQKDTISSVGGNFMILDSDVLDDDMTAVGSTMTITGDTTFAIGDILRIKDGTDDEWLEVTNISNAPTYTVCRDKENDYESGVNCPAWKKGTCVVNYGAPNEGGVYMTSSEENSPFIHFFTHSGSPWSSLNDKTRIGRLDGIAGCSGYGIWGGDGYLGALEVIDTIGISSQGAIRSNLTGNYPYLEFSNNGLMLKDSDTGGTYGTAQYSTDKYGYGAMAWIMNSALKIPFAVLKEPNAGASDVADLRLYNRSDDPGGAAEVGDVCCVSGKLKICTGAGTPGTWTIVGTQS